MFNTLFKLDKENRLYIDHNIKKDFQSSFDNIFQQENEQTKDFLKKWREPAYFYGHIENKNEEQKNELYDIYIRALLYGIPVEVKEGGLYTSVLFIVIDMIHAIIEYNSSQDNIEFSNFTKLLMGGYRDYFYCTGGNGLNLLNEIIKGHNHKPEDMERFFDIQILLDDLTGFHNEIISEDIVESFKKIDKLYTNKENINIKDVYSYIQQTGIGKTIQMKFSDNSIDDISENILDEDTIKALKEIIFERIPIDNPYILIDAIVTSIHSKNDIFLTFDGYSNKMGLYNSENLNIEVGNISSIMNLSSLVRLLFENINLNIKLENQNIFDGTQLKNMFDEIYKHLLLLKPDDIILNIQGKVYNIKRFKELNENINYGDIGFKNHAGKKQSIIFSFEKQLKKYMKKIK